MGLMRIGILIYYLLSIQLHRRFQKKPFHFHQPTPLCRRHIAEGVRATDQTDLYPGQIESYIEMQKLLITRQSLWNTVTTILSLQSSLYLN